MATSASEFRMSVSMVVTQCEDTLKTHLDVPAVTRIMLSAEKSDEILGKATKKYLEKSTKKGVKFLLAVLKKLELPEFVVFLESLEQIGDEKHLIALTTIATHIEFLILPTSESPEDTLLTEAVEKLKIIREAHFRQSKDPDVPVESDSENFQQLDSEDLQTLTSATTEQITEIQSITFDNSRPPSGPSLQCADCEDLKIFTSDTRTGNPDDSMQTVAKQIAKLQIPDSDPILSPPYLSYRSHAGLRATDTPEIVRIQKSGAQLYSSVHGITVTIPPTAVPIQEFELQMSASLDTTIPIGKEYILCSAIVTLTTNPMIEEFSDYITVSMPHCAVRMQDYPEFYCVISHTDGHASFQENAGIEVDFKSQWGYFSFTTKHFSRFAGAGKTKKAVAIPTRTQPMRLAKLKSKSLEQHYKSPEVETVIQSEFRRSMSDPLSQSRYLPDVRFSLGMFTPCCRGSLWKAVFLAYPDNPTGHHAMEQDAARLLEVDGIDSLKLGSPRYSCLFREGHSAIEFSPPDCSCDNWSIKAEKEPAIITKEDMNHATHFGHNTTYVPSLAYIVEKMNHAATSLNQRITANGVLVCDREKIISSNASFTIYACPADSQVSSSKELYFCIFEDLYYPKSKILRALQGGISPSDVELKPDDPDTMILIAELSFCIISKWSVIATFLLEDYEIDNLKEAYYCSSSHLQQQEAAFQVLLTWLKTSVSCANLQCLIDAFNRIGITLCTQKLNETIYMHSLKNMNFHQLSRGTVDKLSTTIASRRRFIGRLLGMAECCISSVASHCNSGYGAIDVIKEEAIAILDKWASIHGYEALLSKFENVIYAIHEHSGHKLGGIIHFMATSLRTAEE